MAQVFSFKLCEIFKNTFFTEHLPKTVSGFQETVKAILFQKSSSLKFCSRNLNGLAARHFVKISLIKICLYKMNSTFFIGDDQMKPNKTLKFYYERRPLRNKTLSSSRNLFKQILQSNSRSKRGAYQKVKWKSV